MVFSNDGLSYMDDLAIRLSSSRLAGGDLRVELFKVHNSLVGKGDIIKVAEPFTSCGSCIRRVQTRVLRHYLKYDYREDGYVEHWNTDNLDKRPLFRLRCKDIT